MEQGLMVFPSSKEDNNKIVKFLDDYGFHAEYQDEFKCWLFEEDEDNYDSLEMELDKYFGKLGINARFEGIFESKSIKNLEFKTFEHYLRLVENESSSTEILSSFGGIIQPEIEWSTIEDSLLLDKDKQPVVYTLVMVGDRLFKTNHIELMKANIGKQIRFKYDASELYPMIIEPKLMGQLVKTLNTNESSISNLVDKFPSELNEEDEHTFNIALITKTNVYYTDDSDGIKMFDHDMKLVLDGGYLTDESLIADILSDNFIWASDDMKYNIKEIKKEHGIKESIDFNNSNLILHGISLDINGNKIIKLSFPNQRSFSIQTNGNLPISNKLTKDSDFEKLSEKELDVIEKECIKYINDFGTVKQKQLLKQY